MKTKLTKDGKLDVELFARELVQLDRARTIGLVLTECRQPEGKLLTDAVDTILRKFDASYEEEPGE